MRKLNLILAFAALFLLGLGNVNAASIDATYNANSGEVTTFVDTEDAYSEFHGEGSFTGTFSAETKHLDAYNTAPWAKAQSSDVIDTEIHASTKGSRGASFSYYGEQEFQKGKATGTNQAAVASLTANGDKASMNVGFGNSKNRAKIVGYDHMNIVRGEATKKKSNFGVSMALFNIDANKLGWANPIKDRANNYVVSEGGQYSQWSDKGKGSIRLYKTKWGRSAVAATHGHTSNGDVDFYDNNNVVLNNNGVWRAYNTDNSIMLGANVANGGNYHANYEIGS